MTTAEPERVYIDANVLIFSIEQNPQWGEPFVRPLMAAIDAVKVIAVTSELTYAEVMVKPPEKGWQVAIDRYEDVFGPASALSLVAVDRDVLRSAALLRGKHHLSSRTRFTWQLPCARNARCSSPMMDRSARPLPSTCAAFDWRKSSSSRTR